MLSTQHTVWNLLWFASLRQRNKTSNQLLERRWLCRFQENSGWGDEEAEVSWLRSENKNSRTSQHWGREPTVGSRFTGRPLTSGSVRYYAFSLWNALCTQERAGTSNLAGLSIWIGENWSWCPLFNILWEFFKKQLRWSIQPKSTAITSNSPLEY